MSKVILSGDALLTVSPSNLIHYSRNDKHYQEMLKERRRIQVKYNVQKLRLKRQKIKLQNEIFKLTSEINYYTQRMDSLQ